MKTEIITLRKDVKPIVSKVESLKIKDNASMTLATEILSQANTKLKELKTERKGLTEPFEEKIDAIEIQFKPSEDALNQIIKTIRNGMSEYQTEQSRLAKIEEDKIASRIGEGKGKLKVETAVAKIDEIDRPAEKVNTGSGSVRFRTDKKLKIVDEEQIPRKYLVPNEKLILEDLKENTKVPGCEIELIQVPINTR